MNAGEEKRRAGDAVRFFQQLGKGKLRGPVDRRKEPELSLDRADLRDGDMEDADRVGL